MKRADRLFATILILQSKSLVRAQELASAFGVTERTIYRDIAALIEAGIPIVSLPGEGYQMMEGFTMPPLMLSIEETGALLLSAKMMQEYAGNPLNRHLQTAVDKLRVILPPQILAESEQQHESVRFYADKKLDLNDAMVEQLNLAIREQRVVHLTYHAYSNDAVSTRDVEPLALTYAREAWYLTAFCRLRDAEREFRLDRIQALTVLQARFAPRRHVEAMQTMMNIDIAFDASALPWVQERQHYAYQSTIDTTDGIIVMRYRVNEPGELKRWLLSFGALADVRAPTSFRDAMRDELQRMLSRYA